MRGEAADEVSALVGYLLWAMPYNCAILYYVVLQSSVDVVTVSLARAALFRGKKAMLRGDSAGILLLSTVSYILHM